MYISSLNYSLKDLKGFLKLEILWARPKITDVFEKTGVIDLMIIMESLMPKGQEDYNKLPWPVNPYNVLW